MKTTQKQNAAKTVAALIIALTVAGFVANVNASSVTVTDITDWTSQPGETPNEIVSLDTPYVPYNGGVYAGINTLSLTGAGADNGVYSGFCIDPFHYSVPSTDGYSIVALNSGLAPKAPGALNAFTATEIEDLWAEYFPSATTSPAAAAGLQVAIWELVSSNAVASGELPSADVISFSGNTYGAAADLASLATYTGPAADLEGLTGPGQDYVIDIPSLPQSKNPVPDGGATFIMLALTLGALVLARPALLKIPARLQMARVIAAPRRSSFKGRRTGW